MKKTVKIYNHKINLVSLHPWDYVINATVQAAKSLKDFRNDLRF